MARTSFREYMHTLDRGLSRGWGLLLALGVLPAVVVISAVDWCRDPEEHPRLEMRDVPDRGEAFSDALFQNVATPMRSGHRVEIVHNGAVFDAIAADVAAAQTSIHVLV